MVSGTLDSITIRGFKSIAGIEALPLRSINLVIGANGSGKSNFIGAVSFLNAVQEGRVQKYVARVGGAERLLHFGSKTTPSLQFHVSFLGGTSQYDVEFASSEDDSLFLTAERIHFLDRSQSATPYIENLLHSVGRESQNGRESRLGATGSATASWIRGQISSWRIFHVHDTGDTSPLRKTNDLHDNKFLRPDGSNLAAFLYFLSKKHPDSYDFIEKTVRRIAPFFQEFSLAPLNLNPDKIRLEWRHAGSEAYFDAASLSDGTLRFIALATLFLQPAAMRPSVILVDEPELGLHPAAISLLAGLIKQAAEQSQCIISTQSSLLLDQFEPEDVLVAERVHGGTTLQRLDPAALEEWLNDYSLGQLWEKNEIGGRPRPE